MTTATARLLEDQVAIVTGGAQGIGRAIATRLGADGARVVLADIDIDQARRTAAELAQQGIDALALTCDVTDPAQVERLMADCTERFGRLDVLVNNAGIARDATLRKMSLDDFTTVMDIHVTGAWLCTKHAVAAMRAHGHGGRIVNISSISGKVGNAGQTNYSTAKAALVGLTKATAKEVARYGIRVNAVQPGLVAGRMIDAMPPEVLAARLTEIPLGRLATAEDVADAVLFLSSGLSDYITGTVLEVTGGRHM